MAVIVIYVSPFHFRCETKRSILRLQLKFNLFPPLVRLVQQTNNIEIEVIRHRKKYSFHCNKTRDETEKNGRTNSYALPDDAIATKLICILLFPRCSSSLISDRIWNICVFVCHHPLTYLCLLFVTSSEQDLYRSKTDWRQLRKPPKSCNISLYFCKRETETGGWGGETKRRMLYYFVIQIERK